MCAESGTERMWGSSPENQPLIDHWLDWEASELKVRGFDGSLPCFLIDRY